MPGARVAVRRDDGRADSELGARRDGFQERLPKTLVGMVPLGISKLRGLIGQKVCMGRPPVLVEPEGERAPVMELLPHGSVDPLGAAVVPLRPRRAGSVQQLDVPVRGHRGQELGGGPGVPRAHVTPPEHRLAPPLGRRRPPVVVFDSFCLVDLSAPPFRERARRSFGSERERADHPVRPTVVVASVTTIGGREGNDRRG